MVIELVLPDFPMSRPLRPLAIDHLLSSTKGDLKLDALGVIFRLPLEAIDKGYVTSMLKVSDNNSILAVDPVTKLPGQLPVPQEPTKLESWV